MKKGFTLIEVMVVMAIIAVLAVMIIGAITVARRTTTETTNRNNSKTVQTAFESQFAMNKMYCGFGGIVCGTTYSVRTIAPLLGLAAGSWKTTCTGTCGGANSCNDGGQVTNLSTTGYTITASAWDCGSFMPKDVYSVQ